MKIKSVILELADRAVLSLDRTHDKTKKELIDPKMDVITRAMLNTKKFGTAGLSMTVGILASLVGKRPNNLY